jgi:hypothetical protein
MRILAILAAGLALAGGTAQAQTPTAQPPPMFSSADAAAATAVIHRYFAAFTAKDYGAFREVFNAPFVQGGREYRILPSLDDVMTMYRGIRDPLDQRDYSASKVVEMRVVPLHAASALAHLHWQRLKKDGSLLNEGAEVLVLAKVDGQWKITGVLGEDLRQFAAAR